MNDATKIAIANAINAKDKKAARAGLSSGTYEVDEVVHVSGTVKVLEDTSRSSTIINEEFLLLVLKMSGCTRDRSAEIIETVSTKILEGEKLNKREAKKARKEEVEKFDADGSIRAMLDKIKETIPRTPVKGKVEFDGDCVPVVVSEICAVA